MSDIIKLNIKPAKLNVIIKDSYEKKHFNYNDEEPEEDELEISYKKGFDEGYLNGKAEAEKVYNKTLKSKYEEINAILKDIEKKISNYEEEFDSVVLETAFTIVEKIVRKETSEKKIIKEILKDSVKKILGANNIIVKLNPAELAEINAESENLFMNESYSKIKFEPDEKIERGGCFVESEIGNVDARISTQINELKKELELYLNSKIEK